VLLATLMSPAERIRFGFGSTLVLLFAVQGLISTLASRNFDYVWPYYTDFAKTATITLVIVCLVNTEHRFRQTLVVIALSLGLEAVKQGWAQLILNPGAQNMNEQSILGDNNGVAVGMLMLTSIVMALATTASRRIERNVARFAAVGIVYRALSTYSRGGFLASGALALQYLLRSKRKLGGVIALALVCLVIIPVLPQAFWDRMQTIESARENVEDADKSVRGRLYFWQVAWKMAVDRPLLGVGLNGYNDAYSDYSTDDEFGYDRSVHSVWFGVLSELGFPGLVLYVALILRAFWLCARVRRLSKRHQSLKNLGQYASGLEGALVAFCVGGTFVVFHYIEIIWHVLALSFVLDLIISERLAVLNQEEDTTAAHSMTPLRPAAAAMGGHFVVVAPVRTVANGRQG
jgi:probable O-glycosylation ligase (exosortase A-associated)